MSGITHERESSWKIFQLFPSFRRPARTCQQQTPWMHRKLLMVRPSAEGSTNLALVIEVHTERYSDGNVQHETTEICE